MFNNNVQNIVIIIILYRWACGVEVDDKFIVTGGLEYSEPDDALKTVAEYSQTGFVRYLPDLIQGRHDHACSSFVNGNGETVGIFLFHMNDNIDNH